MKEKQVIFQNTIIYYKLIGKGLPVVLIHGFGEDSSVWDNQVEFLKDSYNLIVPDLPGSGKSGLLDIASAVGLEDYATCIWQILQSENISQCIMIGHSMGGYITLAFAEKFPSLLLRFGLFHSSAYADDAEKIKARQKSIGFIETNGVDAFMKTSVPGLFSEQSNSNLVDALIEKGKAFSAKALAQYYKAMIARPNRTKILETAKAPVLLIIGEQDKAVPFRKSLQQSHMPGCSHVYILRKSAHMGMLEEPEKSNMILANFLQTV